MKQQCSYCRFSRSKKIDDAILGERTEWTCHRNAPFSSVAYGGWPQVAEDDWCGEYDEAGIGE